MATREVVEVIYGRFHKYEVVRRSGLLGGVSFYIRRDGEPHRGPFSSLRAAVEAVRQEG